MKPNVKFDPKTEKLVETPNGFRIEGEQTISYGLGRNKAEHIYRWRRDVDQPSDKSSQ